MKIGKLVRGNAPQPNEDTTETGDIEALREREDHFRTLIECSLDAITVLNNDGTIRYESSALQQMLGYSSQNRTGHSILDHVHPSDTPKANIFITQLTQKIGSSQHIEMQMQHRDGSWRCIEAKGTNSIDNPVIAGIVIYMSDITDRKNSRLKIKQAEDNYKTLFENSAVAITVVDENENLLSWNKYAESLLGMNKDDLYLKPISALYPEEEWRKMRSMNLRQKGMQHHLETKMIKKNGEILDVDISLSMFKGSDGKIIGTIGIIADISDRKQAQQRLQMVEGNYMTIFENSAVAITLADENERIISWNKYTEILLGADKKELYNMPVRSLYPDEEWEKIRALNIRQKGMQHHLETRLIKKNNDIIDVDISISILKGTEGQITGSIAIITNVTERKKAYEQLRHAEENYRTIFENTAVSITITDANENIVSWNRQTELMLGMDKDDLHTKHISSLYPVAEWEMIRAQNIRKKGMQNHLETKMIKSNGAIIDVDLSVSILRGTDGEISGSIGIVNDITEHKRTREQLKTTTDNYKTLFENTAVAITVANENEKIISWNKYTEVLLGMSRSDLYMRPVSSLYPEVQWLKIRAENIKQKGMQNHLETQMQKKDGETIDVDLSISVLKDSDGEVTGSIAVISNISDLKKAEEEKQRMEQQVQLAGRLSAVGELAAGVAHELNNPLTAVRGFAQLLASRKDLDESLTNDLETIYKEAQRATRITSNLLSFARSHNPEKRMISMNDVIAQSVELQEYRMRVSNIEISTELDKDLPYTMADFYQMQQVFVNLITNAEQAMSDTNGRGKLYIKTEQSGDLIRITVIDDGPGIHEDHIQNIFDPFFTTKDADKGTGLGLSICYSLIREHGGTLSASNNTGEGATFVIELPIITNLVETTIN